MLQCGREGFSADGSDLVPTDIEAFESREMAERQHRRESLGSIISDAVAAKINATEPRECTALQCRREGLGPIRSEATRSEVNGFDLRKHDACCRSALRSCKREGVKRGHGLHFW